MAIKINDTARNVMVQALVDLFDVGTDPITIYGGTEPATASTALAGQTVLSVVELPDPGFGTASAGTVAKAGTWSDLSIDASGTASFFRLVDNGGATIQGSVTATGGGGDMTVDSISFIQGGTFTITSFSLTQPAG